MVTKSRIIQSSQTRGFCCLKVITGGLNDKYKIDLVDMQKLKDKNDGV